MWCFVPASAHIKLSREINNFSLSLSLSLSISLSLSLCLCVAPSVFFTLSSFFSLSLILLLYLSLPLPFSLSLSLSHTHTQALHFTFLLLHSSVCFWRTMQFSDLDVENSRLRDMLKASEDKVKETCRLLFIYEIIFMRRIIIIFDFIILYARSRNDNYISLIMRTDIVSINCCLKHVWFPKRYIDTFLSINSVNKTISQLERSLKVTCTYRDLRPRRIHHHWWYIWEQCRHSITEINPWRGRRRERGRGRGHSVPWGFGDFFRICL